MISLETKEDLLKCLRNELVPENPITEYGIKGLIEYRNNNNLRHPDSMYERYNERTRKDEGKSRTAELFEIIYGVTEPSSDTIFNCWSYFRMFALWRLDKSGQTGLLNAPRISGEEYVTVLLWCHNYWSKV